MDIREHLIALKKDLFDFSKRNPFVHIQANKLWFLSDEDTEARAAKLLKQADFYWKEYGLETSLEVAVFIKWSPPVVKPGSANAFYTSPLFYRPAKIKRIQKIETNYQTSPLSENYFSNPVLRHYFSVFFEYNLPEELVDLEPEIDRLLAFFNDAARQSTEKLVVTDELDETDTWQLIQKEAVGNFNYKKSALGADYDQITEQPNNQIIRLLSGDLEKNELGKSDIKTISFLDGSQREVIEKALVESCVIQGPPGTGKSHTIVALIGALLMQDKKVLFVSEKRSALEVVHKRLTKKGLGLLVAYFNTKKDQKKAFYAHLKMAWEKLNAPHFSEAKQQRLVHPTDLFQLYPATLNAVSPALNASLSDLIEDLLAANKPLSDLGATGKTPTYADWKAAYPTLLDLERVLVKSFEEEFLGSTDLVWMNSVVFSEPEVIVVLEKRLLSMLHSIDRMNALQQQYGLNENFNQLVKLALTASILTMVDKVQMDLLNDESKKYNSFNIWAKKYQLVKAKLKQAEQANQKWTRKPSLSEITELLDLLAHSQKKRSFGVLGRLRRNPEKLKSRFTDFHAGIGDHTKIKLLEAVQLEWRLRGELEELKIKLRHNLSIADPDNEIDLIYNLRNKLSAVSQNEYVQILEHENAAELIHDLSELHPDILQFNAQNRFLFQVYEIDNVKDYAKRLSAVLEKLPLMNHWLPEFKRFFKLPISVRQFVQRNPAPINHLNAVVAYQNLLEETRFMPQFKGLSGWDLMEEARRFVKDEAILNKQHAAAILEGARLQQSDAETLLARPGFKLKDVQKKEKALYRTEKRMILHEINKQQRHLSVKSFFEGAGQHLLKIQPVWMMNPLTVSENLPCQPDLFDVVIFDESSQIPLEDAIPSIYRAKKVIVVGDSKQMPPAVFFSSRDDIRTILDQAEQVLPNTMLKWHYRSKHPDLIRFSNAEFYNNELITFPPQNPQCPIDVKWIEGIYGSGKNPQEAKAIATYCAKLVLEVRKKIVIIAFSQEQEKEIRLNLKPIGLTDHPQITIRNLENAQGIEADFVLVSIGYGKNDSGDFRLNFGPVNQANGANRLNVLFTRAIEKMVIFTSVKSTDFGFSDNAGVQLLKDFLAFAESLEQTNPVVGEMPLSHLKVNDLLAEQGANFVYYPAKNGIGFSSFIQHERNKIILVDPGLNASEGEDVLGILTVLQDQYAEVRVVLSLDLWLNFDRVKEDLGTFFS